MPLRRLSSWLAPGRAGFAGIPGLARPRDWHVLARDAIAQCEALVDEVVRSPPTAAVVRLLDNISDTVGACRVGRVQPRAAYATHRFTVHVHIEH